MPEISKEDIFSPDLNAPLKELQGTLEDVLSTLGDLRKSGKDMEKTFKSTETVSHTTSEETKKLTERIKELEEAQKKLQESTNKKNKSQKEELTALQLLKKELKEAQNAMLKAGDAGGTMSKEYQNAAKKAGELADKIGDAKDEAKVFANDTAFGSLGTRIGLLKDKVLALDFKGVGEQLKGIGKIILANPLLLLAGVVVGISVALFKFKDSIPFVSAALDKIGQGVDYVTGKLKEFTDWIGLTTFAEDEKAKKTVDAANDEIKAINERYDQEIKLAAAAGKEVIDLEIAKQKAIRDTAYAQVQALVGKKDLTDEQKKQLAEFVKITSDAINTLDVLKVQKAEAEKKRTEENRKFIESVEEKSLEHKFSLYQKEQDKRKEFQDKFKSDAIKLATDVNNALYNAQVILQQKIDTIEEDSLQKKKDRTAKIYEFIQDVYLDFSNAVGSIFDSLQARDMQNIEMQRKTNQENLEKELAAAGSNENLKMQLKEKAARQEEVLQERSLKLKQKMAIFDKAQALIAAGINTAVGITNALAKVATIPLIPLITALGALQMVAIAAKPIPKFFKGTSGSPEGLAFVGERGAELMNVPGQGLMLSPSEATLTHLKRGTEIIPHEKSMAMLAGSGIDIGKGNNFLMLNHLQLVNNSVKEIGSSIVNAVQESTGRMYEQGSQVFAVQKRLDGSRKLIRLKSLSA